MYNSATADAASPKVMWGKTELKVGQIGKITTMRNDVTVFKLVNVKTESGTRQELVALYDLPKGGEYRVYTAKHKQGQTPIYGLGGGLYVPQQNYLNPEKVHKYETPSKAKLALLMKK
ncbi:hypothetical protein [Psychrobacillus psychrotolerans]|uniref:hypothetical protein n=1 Tax=Psychrobacillus psychrotolerans TaxID=126156 RepID=UPI000B864573|nr:hypothetical protein [Psychrobacillus psychrotolerans]